MDAGVGKGENNKVREDNTMELDRVGHARRGEERG